MSPWKLALPVLFTFTVLPACSAQVGEDTSTSSDPITLIPPKPLPTLDFPIINSLGCTWVPVQTGVIPDCALTLSGSNFGTAPGRALLFGDFGQYELHVDSWSDTAVEFDYASLTGVKDQQAEWQIIRADGVASAKFTAQFTANRGWVTFPLSLVRIAGCSPNANELNVCFLPTSDTIHAEHVDDENVGAAGYDYYVLPALANGWEYYSATFAQSQGVVYQVAAQSALSGFVGGPSLQYVSVEWQTNGPPSTVAEYDINVQIYGPVGVPYQ